MPDYLTKEEIRQWRSSLERITLEDYAKRLGKVINDEKETNDMVDKVYKNDSTEVKYISNSEPVETNTSFKAERISSLAQQSFEREKELSLKQVKRDLRKNLNKTKKEATQDKTISKIQEAKKPSVKEIKPAINVKPASKSVAKKIETEELPQATIVQQEIQVTFKKNLTPREQAVFEHFLNNKNHIVYAKELAQVLELPRDYVYKYIKNLRAKMNENALQNADNGGFVLQV